MKRVLIVDDKEENLYYLDALLTGHGYVVEGANHGAAALVTARQHPPDLVVSDLLMPVMDGYTLLRHWKADARLKTIPFIVYTATYTEPEDERLALGLGADAFILKPAEPEEFLARIREVEARASEAVRPAPKPHSGDEVVLLKSYSETLIRKLEEKSLQLEESNRALQQDIAERRSAEAQLLEMDQQLRKLNRTYAVLSDLNKMIVREREPQRILESACRIAVEKGRFRLAWIGMLDPATGELEAVASSSSESGSGALPGVDLRDETGSGGPAARSLASGVHVICSDIANAPEFPAWRSEALRRGYQSAGLFPLRVDGEVVGVLGLYASEPEFFDSEELNLLDELATDIGFALEVSRRAAERRVAIEQLRESEERFRQAQKMEAIGQLAGGVAHDFNNILAAILGNAQMGLAETADGHPVRQSLEEIQKAGVRATSLVQQILAFSSQRPQERRVIAMGPTIEEAVGFLRATIPSVVEIVVTTEADVPPVLADPTQVHQVITNLCTNAWHALGDQPGRIDIAVRAVDLDEATAGRLAGIRPGTAVCLCVTDTGEGMDAATIGRVFDPFFTTKGLGKGTGLGLSVVHGIVQAHDGAIRVTSQPGRGTTFEVYLPASAQPVSEEPATAAAAASSANGQHILYLDDEEALVFLAARMLEKLGYRVTGFTSAADAVKAFRENPGEFDLVIADLNMPGASGLQVAAELLKIRPDLPVALCSGHVTEDQREKARQLGIREVLYKPNTMLELSETIDRLAVETRRA